MSRTRTTWGGDRKASAPPATPGYGTEDQGHPAHQPDPAYEEYAKGDPSAWAEDVRQPPYPQGNPPADPGYDVEDQDHRRTRTPRVPRRRPRAQVEKKASKCIRVARVMLGCDATAQMVEDQALDLMDLPEDNLDAMYARMSGGFLAQDEEPEVVDDDIAALLAQDEEPPAEDGVVARFRAMGRGPRAARARPPAANKGGATEEQVKAGGAREGRGSPGGAREVGGELLRQMLARWTRTGTAS